MAMAGGTLSEITGRLHREIPLTGAMGVEVIGWDGKRVTLSAPLGPNVNDKATAFGGSIAALSILAGYTLLYLWLQERGMPAHVLIQKSGVEFLRPIDGEFVAVAILPGDGEVEGFLEALRGEAKGAAGGGVAGVDGGDGGCGS